MNVTSSGIINGVIQPQYGGHGTQFNENGIPACSLPFAVQDAPQGTVSIAIVLEDKDAYPVTGGFAWIHWLAANIARSEIKENESQTADDFVQGRNSWTSIQGGEQSTELSCYYGGMTPPDKPHIYELHVYALDKMLDLERGFLLNELYQEMDGHILDQFTLKGMYEKMKNLLYEWGICMDKILIVEDSMELSDALCRNLQDEGFCVSAASCLTQARKILDSGIDLCLLDLNLPDGDGFTFCRYLSENTAIPIILLTVRDDAQDMVRGLSIGADDYVTKPFHMDVLVSRIRALLRRVRNRKPQDDNLYCGDVCINKKASKVYKKDCPVELTPNEYQLLLLLLEHKNQTITREQILEKMWDMDGNYVNDNTLTTLVKRLRQKVEDHPQMPKMLLTVRGFGYKAVDYEG